MPKHDEYKEIARAVLAHTADVLAVAKRWLRRAELANLLTEFEQRNNKPEAFARDGYASAA